MKIAFWSNSRGRNGVTSNLACISVLLGLLKQQRAVLLENHCHMNNLASAFSAQLEARELLCETSPLIGKDEWNHILQVVGRGSLGQSTISLLENNLLYIPGTRSLQEETISEWMQKRLVSVLSLMEEYVEKIYIDTASSHYESSQIILQEADCVVVNLSQNPLVLQHFFRNFSQVQKKAFYLIGNYSADSIFTKEHICHKYGISKNQLGVIPYHVPFSDSLAEGRLISFLQDNLYCRETNVNYNFIQEVVETAQKFQCSLN